MWLALWAVLGALLGRAARCYWDYFRRNTRKPFDVLESKTERAAFVAGYRAHARNVVPGLKRMYRLRAVGLFWVWVYVAFGLGLATGLAWGSL